jgi:hypothetical protein
MKVVCTIHSHSPSRIAKEKEVLEMMIGPKSKFWDGARKIVDEMNYGVEITEPAAQRGRDPQPKKGATFGRRRITSPEDGGI